MMEFWALLFKNEDWAILCIGRAQNNIEIVLYNDMLVFNAIPKGEESGRYLQPVPKCTIIWLIQLNVWFIDLFVDNFKNYDKPHCTHCKKGIQKKRYGCGNGIRRKLTQTVIPLQLNPLWPVTFDSFENTVTCQGHHIPRSSYNQGQKAEHSV